MQFPRKVKIREVGPRDGFQSIRQFIPTQEKLEIIESLIAAGVPEMETTSFANPSVIPQFQDALHVMETAPRNGIVHSAMVFNRHGAESAIAANAARLVTVVSASESHNRKNLGKSIAETVSGIEEVLSCATECKIAVDGAIAVSFGCPFEGYVPEEKVMQLTEAYLSKGASSIIMADTTGL
ncbi:MAG: hydroxymethylglutaryl-CoA lyase, partial [Thermodesulfobacteriota bacterium]